MAEIGPFWCIPSHARAASSWSAAVVVTASGRSPGSSQAHRTQNASHLLATQTSASKGRRRAQARDAARDAACGEEFLYCVNAAGFAAGSVASGRACGLRPVPPYAAPAHASGLPRNLKQAFRVADRVLTQGAVAPGSGTRVPGGQRRQVARRQLTYWADTVALGSSRRAMAA
jgi:hypothetical protein